MLNSGHLTKGSKRRTAAEKAAQAKYQRILRSDPKQRAKHNQAVQRYRRTLKGRQNTLRCRARRKSVRVSDWVLNHLPNQTDLCYLCEERLGDVQSPSAVSLDRLTAGKRRGYVRGNVAPCCHRCNSAKNTMSKEEFEAYILDLAEKIKERRKKEKRAIETTVSRLFV